jgi:hypothetical protein
MVKIFGSKKAAGQTTGSPELFYFTFDTLTLYLDAQQYPSHQ